MRKYQFYAYTRPDGITGFGFQLSPNPGMLHHSIAWPDQPCQRFTDATLRNQKIDCQECEFPALGVAPPDFDDSSPVNGELQVLPSEDLPADLQPANIPSDPAFADTPPVQVASSPAVTQGENLTNEPGNEINVSSEETTGDGLNGSPVPEMNQLAPSQSGNDSPDFTQTPGAELVSQFSEEQDAGLQNFTAGSQVAEPPPATPAPESTATQTTNESAEAGSASSESALEKPPVENAPSVASLLSPHYSQAVLANVTTERTVLYLIQKVPTASDLDIIRFLNSQSVQVTAEMVKAQRAEAALLASQTGL